MRSTGNAFLLLGILYISACSPYVYSPEITAFSTGVNAVASAYQTGQQSVQTIDAQKRQADQAATRTRLLVLGGCDQRDPEGTPPTLQDCGIVVAGASPPPAPDPAETAIAKAGPSFDALKAYAAALTAVTQANDDATLSKATQSLTTAASGLAGAVAKLDPSAKQAGAVLTPLGTLLGRGITLYLDQRRYQALRDVVPAIDPDVQILGNTEDAALVAIRAVQLGRLQKDIRTEAEPLELQSVSKLSEADYSSKLAAAEASVAAFNQARAASPSASVAAMVAAHHKLAAALLDDTVQAAGLLTEIQDFAGDAQKLETAIDAASKATAKAPASHTPAEPASKSGA